MRVSPLHQQRHCSASRVPPVPHKGLRMYSSAAEATGGVVAITGAVVVQDTPRSSVLGPAIICSRATHVPPVLPLLFPFPPGFAVAPATFYSRAKLDGYAAQIQVQPGTSKRVKQTCTTFSVRRAHRRSCAVGSFRDGQRIANGKSCYNAELSLTYGRDLLRLL